MNNNLPQRFIRFITQIGADPTDSEECRLQKVLLLFSSLMMASLAIAWGSIYMALGEYLAGAIPLTYSVLSFISIYSFSKTHRYRFFRTS
jgi:hypothetical protein